MLNFTTCYTYLLSGIVSKYINKYLFFLSCFYTLEYLKCRFYTTKNIQGFPVAERVNYEFVKATTLTDEF